MLNDKSFMAVGKSKGIITMHDMYIRTVGVISFAFLTALGSHIYIPLPFTPVPLTLQTFFALSSGAVMGAGLGITSQILYTVLGILGMPVFSKGTSGFERILGPTGGYIIGFMLSSYVVGEILSRKNKSVSRTVLGFAAGTVLILACGTVHLALVMDYTAKEAFLKGFLPFIYGDFIKAFVLIKLYGIYNKRALSSVGRAVGS